MKEAYVNKIIEVYHRDGWKYVIQKSLDDYGDSKFFNLEIEYYELNENMEYQKQGEPQTISSLVLPEIISALQEFI